MIIFLNGQFVPETEAKVSVFDRGFLYGDGLFETMRVVGGQPLYWKEHLDRLQRGSAFLKIKLPFTPENLLGFATELIKRNEMPNALLRITLSRGVGLRGYSPKGADSPTLVISLHPATATPKTPLQWRAITASCRLPANEPVAEFKTCNKLPQILARAEADAAGADEALLLNTNGHVVEAASSNLFWINQGVVYTPPLNSGVLAGITRLAARKICQGLGLEIREAVITPAELRGVEGIFLSLSSWGIVEIASLDGHELHRSQLTARIRAAYETRNGLA